MTQRDSIKFFLFSYNIEYDKGVVLTNPLITSELNIISSVLFITNPIYLFFFILTSPLVHWSLQPTTTTT